jgi:hypothetical protein
MFQIKGQGELANSTDQAESHEAPAEICVTPIRQSRRGQKPAPTRLMSLKRVSVQRFPETDVVGAV